MILSFIVIATFLHLLLIKFTYTDLASLSLIKHFLVQLFVLLTVRCNYLSEFSLNIKYEWLYTVMSGMKCFLLCKINLYLMKVSCE